MSESIDIQPEPAEWPVSTFRNQEQFRPKYAGFWIRFWAYTIDLLILSAISGILIKPIFRVADIAISNPMFFIFTPYKIIMVLLMLTYFTMMTKFFKQTIGKMIMGIHVVALDGKDLTWASVIFREVFGRFISKMLLIPYLVVLFMPKKEALHDIFADTYVTHEFAYEKADRQQLQDGSII